MSNYIQMIKEICEEENIGCKVLSKDWVIMLEKDKKTRFISGYKFDLKSHALGNILDDKYALYEVFNEKQIPIIKHTILFSENNKNEYAQNSNSFNTVIDHLKKYNKIVVKANNGTCGNEVYYIEREEDVNPILSKLFKRNFSISVCPFYSIKTEYRLIMLNKECLLAYGKKRPIVVGNGKSSIRELLNKFNPYYFNNKLEETEYSRVLKKGEVFEYGWQFNLSQGSIPFEIKDKKIEKMLLKIADKIVNEINFGFGSIDIVQTNNNEFLVMELNSGVMMRGYANLVQNGYNKAKEIYRKAIQTMFNDNK